MATRSRYDEIKEFHGKRYTGMRVGRSHKWRYEAGEWSERKVTPDRWEFKYAVVKRRAGHAPEGSGAPVGTAYHWYIVADQVVTKLDANSYMTEMIGHKLKVAHRRADRSSWSASERAKRKHLAKLLRELASDLESAPVDAEPAPGERTRARASAPSSRRHGAGASGDAARTTGNGARTRSSDARTIGDGARTRSDGAPATGDGARTHSDGARATRGGARPRRDRARATSHGARPRRHRVGASSDGARATNR